jgi:hypothetical protein
MNKTWQSIAAVFAGAAAGIVVTLATDAILHKAGVFSAHRTAGG